MVNMNTSGMMAVIKVMPAVADSRLLNGSRHKGVSHMAATITYVGISNGEKTSLMMLAISLYRPGVGVVGVSVIKKYFKIVFADAQRAGRAVRGILQQCAGQCHNPAVQGLR